MRAVPVKGTAPKKAVPRKSKVIYTLFALGTDGSMRKLAGLSADDLHEIGRIRNTLRMRRLRAAKKASK